MEEEQAHELYTQFQAVDKGAKQKQGLGFAGAAPGRREFAGDDDDVISRNKRLRGSLFGTSSRTQDADSEGYDSDSAAAVVKRLKQLRKNQGSEAAHETEPRREGERDKGSRRHSNKPEHRSEHRPHHGRSRDDDGRRRRDSRERESDKGSRDAGHNHRGDQRDSEKRRHRDRERDSRDRDRARLIEPRGSADASRRDSHRERSQLQQQQPRAAKPDFERVIPGYASMTAAQKLQARTQYLLERSSHRDKQRQAKLDRTEEGDGQWTRFAFDQNAYLDEEGGRPADPTALDGSDAEQDDPGAAGLGGRRGQLPPRVNAVTFKQSVVQAELQGRDASHEVAIFGRAHANGAAGQAAGDGPPAVAPQAPSHAQQGGRDSNDRGGNTEAEGLTPAQRLRLRLARGVVASSAEPAGHFAGLGAGAAETGWREVPSREEGQTDRMVGGDTSTLVASAGGGEPGSDSRASGGLVDAGIAERQAQLGWRQRALQARQGKQY